MPAFHEFVAHITQEFFASKLIVELGQEFVNQMKVGSEIRFNKATFKYPIGVVEEHEAASGLVGVIYFALANMGNNPLDFNIFMTLMKIAIDFVKTGEFQENSRDRDTKFREFLVKASRELGIDTTTLRGMPEQQARLSKSQESIFAAFRAGNIPYEVAEKVLPKNVLVAGIKDIIYSKGQKSVWGEIGKINSLEEIQDKILNLYVAGNIPYEVAKEVLPVHRFQPLQLPKLTELYRKFGISEEAQATITAMLELGHILRASLEKDYFEEFLRMHGEENAIRRAGLLGITKAVSTALNQVGVSLTERIQNAMEKAFVLHRDWNLRQSIAGGFSTSLMVDYHTSEAIGLSEAIAEFGNVVRSDEKGYINLPVYILNERPENPQNFGFENTGVSIKGSTLWIGRENGAIVIYADGAEYGAIAEELSGNRKINEIIKQSVGREAAVKNISIEWIEVEGKEEGAKGISYSENGNVKVGYALFKEKLERGELLEFTASLRAIRKLDTFTYAHGIIHYLNDVKTLEDFKEYLQQHQKIGNGQILIDSSLVESIIKQIGEAKFKQFLVEARKDGVEVFVMSKTKLAKSNIKQYESLGFAGCIDANEVDNKHNLYNFALGTASEIETVNDFNSPQELEENLKKVKGLALINNLQLRKVINGERTGLSITQIVEMLSSFKILKIFANKPITVEFAFNAGRNFEIANIPRIDEDNIVKLNEMIKNGIFELADLVEALGISEDGADAVSVYLAKLQNQTEGKENSREIMNAFVKGIVERVLVAHVLRVERKEFGLKDKNQEIILGRAIVIGIQQGTNFDKNDGRILNSFVAGLTVSEAESKLNEALPELMEQAFEQNDPKAINAIIELIPGLAERRETFELSDDIKPRIDIRNYANILSAA